MNDDEFWSASDSQLEALAECWKDRQQRADIRVARHLAFHANLNRDRKKKPTPYTEKDFIPTLDAKSGNDMESCTERLMQKREMIMHSMPHMFKKADQ